MFCVACGAKSDEGSAFCAKCGARLRHSQGQPESPGPVPNSAVPRPKVRNSSRTNLIIIASCVCGLVLLGIGAAVLIPKMGSPGSAKRYRLVLQVMTDDSINIETEQEVARLAELLKKNAISFQKIAQDGLGRIGIQGILEDQEAKIRSLFDEYTRTWDYTFVSGGVDLALKPLVDQYLRDEAVMQTKETIDNRINAFHASKPLVRRQSTDKIVVELSGVDDPERIKQLIKVPAVMEWKVVKTGPAADEATLLQATKGQVPEDAEVITGDPRRGQGGFYLVDKVATVTGKDLRTIRRTMDELNNPAVSFILNAEGGARFEQVTRANVGKQIAIILDKKVQSAPVIEGPISLTQGGIIRGRFTAEEVDDLVIVLKAGSLPCKVKFLEEKTI